MARGKHSALTALMNKNDAAQCRVGSHWCMPGHPPSKEKDSDARRPHGQQRCGAQPRGSLLVYAMAPLPTKKITTPSLHKGEERCSVPLLGWPVACALAPMCDEKTRIRMTKTLAGFGQARRVYTRAPLLFVFLPGERRPAVHRLVGLSLRGEVPCWLWCGSNDVPNDARREPSGTVGQVCVFAHVSVSVLRLEFVSISQVPKNNR